MPVSPIRLRPLAVLLLALASVGALGMAGSAAEARSQPVIQRGGTLVVTLSAEPIDNFDPLRQTDGGSATIMINVIEPLVRLDEQLRPVPWLARAFEQPDPQTYIFKLRTGVRFHDGTPMDAEAVKFSVDRIRTDPAATDFALAQVIVESTVVDPETLLIRLREPYAPFLSLLTGRAGMVVSAAALRSQGADDFNRNPVGTGPFRLIRYESGKSVRVERFDGHWRTGADGMPLPYLDAVEWRIMTDGYDRFEALLDGAVQIADTPIAWDDLISDDPELVVAYDPTGGFGYEGLVLAVDRPPFDNRALRQAVAFAINRVELNDCCYGGGRVAAHGPIPPAIGWVIDPAYRPYTYDPVSAILKLQEAGYPNGFAFEAWSTEPEAELIELIALQLADIGIEMRVRLAPTFAVLQQSARASIERLPHRLRHGLRLRLRHASLRSRRFLQLLRLRQSARH